MAIFIKLRDFFSARLGKPWPASSTPPSSANNSSQIPTTKITIFLTTKIQPKNSNHNQNSTPIRSAGADLLEEDGIELIGEEIGGEMDREMEMNGNHPNQRMRGRRGRGSGSGWRGYLFMKRGYFSHFTPHGCFGKLCAKEVSSTIYFLFWMDGGEER